MPGKRLLTGCMVLLFLLSILSMWIPIPRMIFKCLSLLLFLISGFRNCIYYRKVKGRHSTVLWLFYFGCIIVAGLSIVTTRFVWQILYIVLLYFFFILAGVVQEGKFRKSYLVMGICVICMMLVKTWTNNIWIARGVLVLQVILLLRLLNPVLEGLAERGRRKCVMHEEYKKISIIRRILFGRSGKLRFPGITN